MDKSFEVPSVASEGSLSHYLREIKKFPMLERDEEYTLARRWIEHQDKKAAHELVTSHLRLVAKIAGGYRGYGLPMGEMIAEGNIGLMHAVKRFAPEKGFRLSTYAVWWIRATIQEYILKSWSLVKVSSSSSQKRLFFSLKRLKREIKAADEGDLTPAEAKKIAKNMGIREEEVLGMNRRLLQPDVSLNVPIKSHGEDGTEEWQDWLVDERENQETKLLHEDEHQKRYALLTRALEGLTPRESEVLKCRRLKDPPETLEILSKKLGVSRERVRQIEVGAFHKLQLAMKNDSIFEGLA
ncbi:MAG: RNA polymerase sigma factor RpoH [Alphaproteobacteria bacterium]|jgi:RNA polymerase sigma-32 factor|nr:RNA polymerase sigma factor RpoH [Alphaproteobacteria bacterium]MBT5390579.1 RNA polymerase sigma factor RpoH [Alphaproteobacteria bacterium]